MKPTISSKLSFIFTEDAFRVDQPGKRLAEREKELEEAFLENRYKALFALGFRPRESWESPSLLFLHQLSEQYLRSLTDLPDLEVMRDQIEVPLPEDARDRLLRSVPFGLGTEWINEHWLREIYRKLTYIYAMSISDYDGTVKMFLAEKSQDLRVPERIFFHLVEADQDDSYPFAFLATYATKDEQDHMKHLPLSYALQEYKEDRERLLALLSCLDQVSEKYEWIAGIVESGEMFYPLRMDEKEAYDFLKHVPVIEECGIICRVPNWWSRHHSSVSMQVELGGKKGEGLGFESIVSMQPSLVVDGIPLTQDEIRDLLAQSEGLVFLKGRWVESNHARLKALLRSMEQYKGEISLLEALRMENGLLQVDREESDDIGPVITNGEWLGGLMMKLRQPADLDGPVPETVYANLRPYQETGFRWLSYMTDLGFGACLADDMGLGKTLQVLTYLSGIYEKNPEANILLIVPASLVNNWAKEAEKFTPSLPIRILHGMPARTLGKVFASEKVFLNITTYQMALRIEELQEASFDCLILDEAQAIKNPGTKQTRAIKQMNARQKIAMTGTPIENDLSNLWSLFDFLNKGLLGSSTEFRDYSNALADNAESYQKLKNMVSPFILRRVKTDKSIISDLPDKVEQIDYVSLSKKQIVLYRKEVKRLEDTLNDVSGMERRGIVLATIQRLKQLCNHPDQYLGQEAYTPRESGKFELLRELADTIYEKRERMLLFTQYKSIIPFLHEYLAHLFGAKGLVLHGGTRVKDRQKLVDQFNGEEYVPYMILSLKAGGTGLNLTAANHVVHFDRWWNPAVENQATDRAFRIGQKKNVMVHKLVSTGTIEEKIDNIISGKKELAENVIGDGGENWITEMDDETILNLMRLDL